MLTNQPQHPWIATAAICIAACLLLGALPAATQTPGDPTVRTLSGQVTAWAAQWNGDSFNQGSPKPDGSLPKPTTKLTGTYNPTTRAFTLVWTSLIVGGPFNGFAGYWHLAGTFVPAS